MFLPQNDTKDKHRRKRKNVLVDTEIIKKKKKWGSGDFSSGRRDSNPGSERSKPFFFLRGEILMDTQLQAAWVVSDSYRLKPHDGLLMRVSGVPQVLLSNWLSVAHLTLSPCRVNPRCFS